MARPRGNAAKRADRDISISEAGETIKADLPMTKSDRAIADRLVERRNEILAEIHGKSKEMELLRTKLRSFEDVLGSFGYDFGNNTGDPVGVSGSPKIIRAKLQAAFEGIRRQSCLLHILKEAGRPLTTAECAARFIEKRNIVAEGKLKTMIGSRLSHALDAMAKKGEVSVTEVGPHRKMWSVPKS